MNVVNIQPALPNRPTMAQLEAIADDLGKQHGYGRDTQIKFLKAITEHSYHGNVDLKPNKHGPVKDDATMLAERYCLAQGTATLFDAKAPNQRKLVSTLRTAIRLGQTTAGGAGEPMATVNKLMAMREKLMKNKQPVDDAANTFLRFARAMKGRDTMIEGAELEEFCHKPVSADKEAEDIISDIRDSLNRLINGQAGHGKVQDNSPEVREAAVKLTERLIQMAKDKAAAGTSP